jgi:hypothetical protein
MLMVLTGVQECCSLVEACRRGYPPHWHPPLPPPPTPRSGSGSGPCLACYPKCDRACFSMAVQARMIFTTVHDVAPRGSILCRLLGGGGGRGCGSRHRAGQAGA